MDLRVILVPVSICVTLIMINEYHRMTLSQQLSVQLERSAQLERRIERLEDGGSVLADTIAYHASVSQVESSVVELEAAVASCVPKPDSKRVCKVNPSSLLLQLPIADLCVPESPRIMRIKCCVSEAAWRCRLYSEWHLAASRAGRDSAGLGRRHRRWLR